LNSGVTSDLIDDAMLVLNLDYPARVPDGSRIDCVMNAQDPAFVPQLSIVTQQLP
jgi:hypothetical protein